MINPLAHHPLPLDGHEVRRTSFRPSRSKGVILVELILLGLAGLGGLALLLQSKPLPSQEDAEKAFKVLDKDPMDPDANTTFGKWKAFVQGDYEGAMPYLVHSKDVTLKTLAEHELDDAALAVPTAKVAMGDEWVAAAKKLPALSRIFYDRAAQWYIKAWPSLEGQNKEKLRLQGRKIAVSRPVGPARKGVPADWQQDVGVAGRPPVLDGNVSRTGSYSIKIPPADEKVQNSVSALVSNLIPINGKDYELAAYILADGTENAGDRMGLRFFDATGAMMGTPASTFYPLDLPFWNRVALKGKIPDNAVRAQVVIALASKKGTMWVDDVSLKVDGKDVLKNGSFEDK